MMIAVESEEELEKLRRFQLRIADLKQDDVTCIRFLIGERTSSLISNKVFN
jgi:hypothetical protein